AGPRDRQQRAEGEHRRGAGEVVGATRLEQRRERGGDAEPRRHATDDESGRARGSGRAAEQERHADAERERRAPAARESNERNAQHLIPACSATTPALMLWTSTWPKPAVFIIAFSVSWSGWTRIDSAR